MLLHSVLVNILQESHWSTEMFPTPTRIKLWAFGMIQVMILVLSLLLFAQCLHYSHSFFHVVAINFLLHLKKHLRINYRNKAPMGVATCLFYGSLCKIIILDLFVLFLIIGSFLLCYIIIQENANSLPSQQHLMYYANQ